MSLNDIKTEFSSEISSMADDLNNSLPFSKPQLRASFTDKQLEELHKMIKEINEATTKNSKIIKLQENAKIAFDLLKKLGVAI